MKKRKLFYALVILQTLVLLGIAGTHFATLHFGDRIVLKTEPIDPRDLFHGDYVRLNYDISTLSKDLWRGEGEVEYHDKVFVVLQDEGSSYKAVSINEGKPALKSGEVAIKGVVQSDMEDQVFVDYGIERFYIEEGTGKKYEDDPPQKVAVRVAPWGQLSIEELLDE